MINYYETERLILRQLGKEAAPMVLAFYLENRDQFEPWEPKRSPNFYTLSYQKAFLTAEYNQSAEGKLLRYWAFLKNKPDEIAGSVCFQNILKEPYHSCSIGYKFGGKYQHQGYALECIRRSIELMFSEYHLHRINAFIMQENTPSLQLIKRLSFHYEGTCQAFARINGIWTDHEHYALVNPVY
ncbi:ribosomal-protein-alanine N-acetyltransferase [Anaerotaenia torta]|uniref:GNAT family N-acetyltransferase n=1 Tax=Anaerotaenia torta TaxID=433293 RepID=UPI003D224AEB